VEILIADETRRYQAVGAGFIKLDEQAGAGDPGNVPVEGGADAIGEEMRDQPVGGFALGFHGAPLGGRNVGGDFSKRARLGRFGQSIRSELLRADQRAMHDKIGIAADRRCEMRVAPQVQSKMAEILRRIFRLRLAAQHHFVDQPLDLAALDPLQNAVERVRAQRAALGQ
jgi:hypothetical protein